MNEWLDALLVDGFISKVVIDSYQRETERYGGPTLIRQAEEYFYNESKFVMNMLKKQRYEGLAINFDYIGISMIVSILESFGLSIDGQKTVLDTMSSISAYRKEFQDNRKNYMRAASGIDDWFEIRSSVPGPEIYDLLNINAQALKKYAEAIYTADKQGSLTNPIKDIVFSVFHMFCNRLMGNNAWERKVYSLARHGVHGSKGFLQNRDKNLSKLELPERLI